MGRLEGRELIGELSEAIGVAGQEGEVRQILRRRLQEHADQITLDRMGNLIARKGSGPLKVVLDAHTDEVGALVKGYTADGLLELKVHGLAWNVTAARRVWVGRRRLPGVIGSKALHKLSSSERERLPEADDLLVDIGAHDAKAAEGLVEIGEQVVFATRFESYSERVVKGKAFDDRAGCALALLAFVEAHCPQLTLYAVFAAQEEVGLRGARAYASALQPHVGIVLEATAAGDGPGTLQPRASTVLGAGPVLSLVDNGLVYSPVLRAALEQAAAAEAVQVQYRRLTTAGNDAGALAVGGAGVHAAALSLPCRYIHSPAALLDLQDFDDARRLLTNFLAALNKEEVPL